MVPFLKEKLAFVNPAGGHQKDLLACRAGVAGQGVKDAHFGRGTAELGTFGIF